MFRFTQEPSSGSQSQCLAKITGMVPLCRIRTDPDPARKLSANLYYSYHCCVYSGKLLMTERGTVRNM